MMILKTSRSNLSSNDQLALDLPFAATKSLTARVGPTPTFTRGSGATYIGSDGLIHGTDTSTTSNTIGTGSRTFTLAATAGQDQFWRAGNAVEASNGSNFMVGTVTSYTPSTQVLVCNMTSIGGSGTFTSWRIGYRGPRFDHTSAGVCRGLLIEESRTNSITRSQEMNLWGGAGGSTRAVSTENSPDGTTKATIVTSGSSSFGGIIARSLVSVSSITGTQYSASCFVRKDNWRYVSVDYSPLRPSGTSVPFFDLDTLTFNANGATVTGVITSYPNGWYRLAVSGAAITSINSQLDIILTTSSGLTSAAVGGLTANIWGAQLEAGSFPTSYIPTTTGSVVRSADVCSITGANFTSFYNNDQGTMVTVASANGFTASNNAIAGVDSGTTVVMRVYHRVAQGNRLSAQVSATTLTPAANYNTANVVYKSAITADSAGADYVIDGTQIPDTFTGSVLTADNLKFTGMSGSTSNATISSFRYYRKRLPVSKLQALTA
jgi:hypothetical protein